MDIIAEKIPDEEPGRSDALEEAQLDTAINVSAAEQPEETPEPPAPKKRGRPAGSRNKPKVIEEPPPEPVIVEPPKEDPPKPKRATKPRAKAAPPPTPQYYEQPSQTPLQVAANMLEILRLEQAERQYRKSQLYKSWIQ